MKFTPREVTVLRLLVRGMPNKMIAHILGISMGTVKVHMKNIMRKAGVRNRVHLIVVLAREAWVMPA